MLCLVWHFSAETGKIPPCDTPRVHTAISYLDILSSNSKLSVPGQADPVQQAGMHVLSHHLGGVEEGVMRKFSRRQNINIVQYIDDA